MIIFSLFLFLNSHNPPLRDPTFCESRNICSGLEDIFCFYLGCVYSGSVEYRLHRLLVDMAGNGHSTLFSRFGVAVSCNGGTTLWLRRVRCNSLFLFCFSRPGLSFRSCFFGTFILFSQESIDFSYHFFYIVPLFPLPTFEIAPLLEAYR